MILEIYQIIWLTTPRGTGLAKFLIDNGPEADLQWTVFLENGEVWTYGNEDVRAATNITLGRLLSRSPPRRHDQRGVDRGVKRGGKTVR